MGRLTQRVSLVSLVSLASLVLVAPGLALAGTNPAVIALNQGRASDAIEILKPQLVSDPGDAVSHQLLCRVYYAEENFNSAIHECEAAVADASANDANASDSYLWLGRAYGMKASQVNLISAFTLARKVVAAFERSVALDPENVAAMRDLGEYYVNAPAIVGGGLDKARALSVKMMGVSPAKAHRLLAQIAEKSGDDTTAEAEFKRAVDSQRTAESYVDLAQFYLARKQFDQLLSPIHSAVRLDTPRGPAAVDAAAILISSDRSLPLAEQLLREYLASPAKSDGAPAFHVHVQLGDLLFKRGDRPGALREYDAALALAPGFAPAKRSRAQAIRPAASTAAPQTAARTSGGNAIP